jgi:hypothetical protein
VPEVLKVFEAEVLVLPPFHTYEVPPAAFKFTLPQPVVVPEIDADGKELTVTIT